MLRVIEPANCLYNVHLNYSNKNGTLNQSGGHEHITASTGVALNSFYCFAGANEVELVVSHAGLDVQIPHVLRVRLDEALAGGDGVAHEHVERLVGDHGVVDGDLEEGSGLRVHRRLPQLDGVHL